MLLEVKDLSVCFHTHRGRAVAVDGVSFNIQEGKTLCIVGESGCGKSATGNSILRLLPKKVATISGSVMFGGCDLLSLSEIDLRRIRGNQIAMIFQEPMTSLNPVLTVGYQVAESLKAHGKVSSIADAGIRVDELFKSVEISPSRSHDYPFEMSGGMRQRVMIAMALACEPKLLIADEPTTALDVTIQAQILDLIRSLKTSIGMSILLITHDMGIVKSMADDILVMYSGRVAERAPNDFLFGEPLHPYTQGLLSCIPEDRVPGSKLLGIPGQLPSLFKLPQGCYFQDRCPIVQNKCREKIPPLEIKRPLHSVCCTEIKAEIKMGDRDAS